MPHLKHAKITDLFQCAKNMKNKTRRDETLIEIRVGFWAGRVKIHERYGLFPISWGQAN